MICSMTAFGSARRCLDDLTLTLEVRSVNSRFLDLHLRLPEDLRQLEVSLRDLFVRALARGKVEVRVNCERRGQRGDACRLAPERLQRIAAQWQAVRTVLPETPAPALLEVLNWPDGDDGSDGCAQQARLEACLDAARDALAQLQDARRREGARLAEMIRDCTTQIAAIVTSVEQALPDILSEHRLRLAMKLHEAVETAFPAGFNHISGEELSERLSQESALFALRIDVAEEVSRLRAHLVEIEQLLGDQPARDSARHIDLKKADPRQINPRQSNPRQTDAKHASIGKRLDFLCQELNREANTLGSKAGSVAMTRYAMDLKLLIEQIREQAQNLE